jgi:hypothetical protein
VQTGGGRLAAGLGNSTMFSLDAGHKAGQSAQDESDGAGAELSHPDRRPNGADVRRPDLDAAQARTGVRENESRRRLQTNGAAHVLPIVVVPSMHSKYESGAEPNAQTGGCSELSSRAPQVSEWDVQLASLRIVLGGASLQNQSQSLCVHFSERADGAFSSSSPSSELSTCSRFRTIQVRVAS